MSWPGCLHAAGQPWTHAVSKDREEEDGMFDDLNGKTALITGAGRRSGMGYAIASRLASLGVQVIVSDLGEAAGAEGKTTAPE